MEKEVLVIAFFGVLALITHLYTIKHEGAHAVAASTMPIITHPVVFDTVRDYCIHFVVYSGYVFGH